MLNLSRLRALVCAVFSVAVFLSIAPAHAADDPARVQRLAVQVERAEALRAVKRLQYAYSQYGQYGLWQDMADLFSAKAEIQYGAQKISGKTAIGAFFRKEFGAGRDGLVPGGENLRMQLAPVVLLAADGKTATGRWQEFSLLGAHGAQAHWAGGVQDNDYVKEDGVWKIARLHFHPQFAGPYDTGWRALEKDIAFIPYRFKASELGRPIPPAPDGLKPSGKVDLVKLETRLDAMAAEDAVRNLQNAYGYYVDRKMWDDVAELFTADGTMSITGIGAYDGAKSIRKGLERNGPAGLKHGELNDHMQIGMVITIAPNGTDAVARGQELAMIGQNNQSATWSETTFENKYVRQDGKWRIKEMRLLPKMKADYYQGWGKSAVVDPVPTGAAAPDRPAKNYGAGAIPAFSYAHPVTGATPHYPQGAELAGRTPTFTPISAAPATPLTEARLTEAERKLHAAIAFDAIENLSSGFKWYDDDGFSDEKFWDDFVQMFTAKGGRSMPATGIYYGRDRIRKAQVFGKTEGRVTVRTSQPLHMRLQPVIHVSADGKSAHMRARLFQAGFAVSRATGFTGGMYEDKLEYVDGAWLYSLMQIDHVWRTPGYEAGWAKVPENFGVRRESDLAKAFPPDAPPKGVTYAPFPSIGPMWFHYPNPVSGRVPKDYWPD